MSILDRLNMLIRSEVNALGGRPKDAAPDPRSTLREAADSLVTLRRAERALADRYQDTLDRIDRVEAVAVDQLRRGDEAAAKDTLRDKAALERESDRLRAELDHHRVRLDELRGALHTLRARVADARQRQRGISAAPFDTYSPATSATDDAFAISGDSLERFGEFESRISAMEAELRADQSLDADALSDPLIDPDGARVEREFRELEARRALDDVKGTDSALDRLRKAMNPDSND